MAVRRWYQGADDQPTIEEEIEALEAGGGREATSPERYRAAVRDPLGVEPNYRVVKTAPGEPLSARTRSQVLSGFPELKETLDAGPVPRVWAQKPRYFRDDEWKPASWGSEAIIALQRALAVAGYLDLDSMPPLGRWDPTSRNAYADLLAEANAAGLTAEE
ncbi:MAG: hypothetical protein GWN06_07800, partial [Gemmatimonadetes bacterium]|nr:hypothetical protein [Gemmatimonadota bacterium]